MEKDWKQDRGRGRAKADKRSGARGRAGEGAVWQLSGVATTGPAGHMPNQQLVANLILTLFDAECTTGKGGTYSFGYSLGTGLDSIVPHLLINPGYTTGVAASAFHPHQGWIQDLK